jgi:hypothetical protein
MQVKKSQVTKVEDYRGSGHSGLRELLARAHGNAPRPDTPKVAALKRELREAGETLSAALRNSHSQSEIREHVERYQIALLRLKVEVPRITVTEHEEATLGYKMDIRGLMGKLNEERAERIMVTDEMREELVRTAERLEDVSNNPIGNTPNTKNWGETVHPKDAAAYEQAIADAVVAYQQALRAIVDNTGRSEREIEPEVLGYCMPKNKDRFGKGVSGEIENIETKHIALSPKLINAIEIRDRGYAPPKEIRSTKIRFRDNPHSISELIRTIEYETTGQHDPTNIEKAEERLSPQFEEMLRKHPETLLPRTMLHVEDGNGGIKYLLPDFFNDRNGRPMVVSYMVNSVGEVRVAIAYMSSSQAAWRLLTDIYGIYDKGRHGEFSITLPYEVQQTLDTMYGEIMHTRQRMTEIEPRDIVICAQDKQVDEFWERHERIQHTQYFQVDDGQTDQPQWMQKIRMGREENGWKKEREYDKIQEFTDGLKHTGLFPHFGSAVATKNAYSQVYGKFVRAMVPSENGEFRYIFNITKVGTFLVNVEATGSNKNKYGLNEELPVIEFPEIMMLPIVEYAENIEHYKLNGGNWFTGDYFHVLNHHNRIELLAKASQFFSAIQQELKSS